MCELLEFTARSFRDNTVLTVPGCFLVLPTAPCFPPAHPERPVGECVDVEPSNLAVLFQSARGPS